MSQGEALPRVPERVTRSHSAEATMPTDCADLQVQICRAVIGLVLGRNYFFQCISIWNEDF